MRGHSVDALLMTAQGLVDTFVKKTRYLLRAARNVVSERGFQVTVASAILGASFFGPGIALAGLVVGGIAGFCFGFLFIPLTFGLSVPFCVTAGAVIGFFVGAFIGCMVGMLTGGVLGHFGYAKRETLWRGAVTVATNFHATITRQVAFAHNVLNEESLVANESEAAACGWEIGEEAEYKRGSGEWYQCVVEGIDVDGVHVKLGNGDKKVVAEICLDSHLRKPKALGCRFDPGTTQTALNSTSICSTATTSTKSEDDVSELPPERTGITPEPHARAAAADTLRCSVPSTTSEEGDDTGSKADLNSPSQRGLVGQLHEIIRWKEEGLLTGNQFEQVKQRVILQKSLLPRDLRDLVKWKRHGTLNTEEFETAKDELLSDTLAWECQHAQDGVDSRCSRASQSLSYYEDGEHDRCE